MSETDSHKAIWPTFALRAWLGALHAQVRRARETLEHRIDATEKEVARLRRQHERAGTVIEALQEAMRKVDERLRLVRDTEYLSSAEKHGGSRQSEAERVEAREGNRPEPGKPADQAPPGKEASGPQPGRGPDRPR